MTSMPAVRSNRMKLPEKENKTLLDHNFIARGTEPATKVTNQKKNGDLLPDAKAVVDLALQSKDKVYFPVTQTERNLYKTEDGKKLTPHQWAVYDLTREIPCGKVTTYKYLCERLGAGSPRSVGSALRHNPFAPYIPCHRVIASDLTLGGFYGEWGTQGTRGSHCSRKVEMLESEGVKFGKNGKLLNAESVLWK